MTEVRAGSSEVRATATEELLPCPFCGGKAKLVKQSHALYFGGKLVRWKVSHACLCGTYISTKCCGTKTEAKRMWNRRADHD